jgi:hypothetical protein
VAPHMTMHPKHHCQNQQAFAHLVRGATVDGEGKRQAEHM